MNRVHPRKPAPGGIPLYDRRTHSSEESDFRDLCPVLEFPGSMPSLDGPSGLPAHASSSPIFPSALFVKSGNVPSDTRNPD